ncbi:geranyl diphosphate synthase 1, partial [Tanacetum coccineum]
MGTSAIGCMKVGGRLSITEGSTWRWRDCSLVSPRPFSVREISVLTGEFLPSSACMTLASLKTTKVVSLITTAVEHLVTGEMMQMSTSAGQSR